MKKKRKSFHKTIVFGKQPLVVFSKFLTHPVTGFTLEEINERINFDFLDDYSPGIKPKGRKPLPFKAKCKMLIAFFCERMPSLSELARKLEREKKLREFCGFEKNKTPKKQTISDFIIGFPNEKLKAIFSEFHQQLQRIEYVESNTVSVDACIYRTVNKRPDKPKIMKRNNETKRMKKVYGLNHVTAVLSKTCVCSGFITDFEGHHESQFYENVLHETSANGYDFDYATADKAFDSNELRWNTLLYYGAEAVIPKRKNKKKGNQKSYRQRRRKLKNFVSKKQQKIYDNRTAVERYYSKIETALGLQKLKTKRDESGRTLLAFANVFDVVCRTTHLYKTLENAMVPLT